jgi:hypothetical protein
VTGTYPKKMLFRASKQLWKFTTRKIAKNSKLSKLLESCFEPDGKGGWPPISTWIIGWRKEKNKTISNFGRKRKYLICLCNISSTSR